jgi:hypothetical protein
VLPGVLRSGRPLLLWELLSRKLLRYCTPFLFAGLAASNAVLWTGVYGWTLLGQGLVYGLALSSFAGRHAGLTLRPLSFLHYFVLGNVATLLGWWKVLRGRELTKWETGDRAYDGRIPAAADTRWTLSGR